jgi:SPP1 gp7 family putative phage head morphogenesis protein
MDKARIDIIVKGIDIVPGVLTYLSLKTRLIYAKAAPKTRSQLERLVMLALLASDEKFLARLDPLTVSSGFWIEYQREIERQITLPVRQYIEQSFSNYSDYVNFIDKVGAVGDIDTLMTRAIADSAATIANNTRKKLEELLAEGLTPDEVRERIAFRFSQSHAEQVAVTEITRAEAQFSEALQSRLAEQNVKTNIRWLTSEDEKVCPICMPLDGKLKKNGGWMTKNGLIPAPPAHPNCRCQTVVELE